MYSTDGSLSTPAQFTAAAVSWHNVLNRRFPVNSSLVGSLSCKVTNVLNRRFPVNSSKRHRRFRFRLQMYSTDGSLSTPAIKCIIGYKMQCTQPTVPCQLQHKKHLLFERRGMYSTDGSLSTPAIRPHIPSIGLMYSTDGSLSTPAKKDYSLYNECRVNLTRGYAQFISEYSHPIISSSASKQYRNPGRTCAPPA